MLYIYGVLIFHPLSAPAVIVRGREFGLETTGLLHAQRLSRSVRAPVALLTFGAVGRYGAVFPFASWADGTKVKLPTRILLKRPVFVVASLRSSFETGVRHDLQFWRLGSAAAGSGGEKG